MLANGFTFGDRNTWDFDMRVEKLPVMGGAVRRVTAQPIPGRNGALHIDEGVFDSYQQEYACYFHGNGPTATQTHAIRGWLMTGGQRRLTDVYDPDHFHLATFTGPLDVENILNCYGRCVLRFDFDPRAFLLVGEEPVVFNEPGVLVNPTAYPAQPQIYVWADEGAGAITVGNRTVQINGPARELVIDCESMAAYDSGGSRNRDVSCVEFPELLPGENEITWSGSVRSVGFIPRWWEL